MSDVNRIYYPVSSQMMTHGEGVYLYDADGSAYIDCASATFNLSLGYGHPAVLAAIQDQSERLIHVTSRFQTEQINRLSARLIDFAPKRLTRAHLKVSGGSSANEGAIKMAQRSTGRRDIVTLFRSHLGQTMMMTSMSGNAFRKAPFPQLYPGSLQVPDPYCYRCFYNQEPETCGLLCVERIDDFLEFASSGSVAAILIEPISGNGGNIVPPAGYFTSLRDLCDQHDIKLIFDEVQTGIGRTGHMFAADYFGVEPDALTVAKGLGGSGAQIAGILASEELAGLPSDDHSFTYGANLLAAAAANATLDVISDAQFLENVRNVGRRLMERLKELQCRNVCIGDVRGVGLMIGIEIVNPEGRPDVALTNAIAQRAMEVGLILRTSRYGHGNVIKIRPPLILTMAQADEICDRLERLMRNVTS